MFRKFVLVRNTNFLSFRLLSSTLTIPGFPFLIGVRSARITRISRRPRPSAVSCSMCSTVARMFSSVVNGTLSNELWHQELFNVWREDRTNQTIPRQFVRFQCNIAIFNPTKPASKMQKSATSQGPHNATTTHTTAVSGTESIKDDIKAYVSWWWIYRKSRELSMCQYTTKLTLWQRTWRKTLKMKLNLFGNMSTWA